MGQFSMSKLFIHNNPFILFAAVIPVRRIEQNVSRLKTEFLYKGDK